MLTKTANGTWIDLSKARAIQPAPCYHLENNVYRGVVWVYFDDDKPLIIFTPATFDPASFPQPNHQFPEAAPFWNAGDKAVAAAVKFAEELAAMANAGISP